MKSVMGGRGENVVDTRVVSKSIYLRIWNHRREKILRPYHISVILCHSPSCWAIWLCYAFARGSLGGLGLCSLSCPCFEWVAKKAMHKNDAVNASVQVFAGQLAAGNILCGNFGSIRGLIQQMKAGWTRHALHERQSRFLM